MPEKKLTITEGAAITSVTALKTFYFVQMGYKKYYESINETSKAESAETFMKEASKAYKDMMVAIYGPEVDITCPPLVDLMTAIKNSLSAGLFPNRI